MCLPISFFVRVGAYSAGCAPGDGCLRVTMQHCIMCGIPDQAPGSYKTETISDLIRERYSRGPLVYPTLMAWPLPTVCVCRQCFHQLKRRKRTSTKQPLPMDATLLQTLIPGHMRQQDSRTRERMCLALMTPGNSYSRSFGPLPTLLRTHRLRQWWEHNLRTEFFSHKTTARLIRKAINRPQQSSGSSTPPTGSTSSTC